MPYVKPVCPVSKHVEMAASLDAARGSLTAVLDHLAAYDRKHWPHDKTRFNRLFRSAFSALSEIRSMLDNELMAEHGSKMPREEWGNTDELKVVYYHGEPDRIVDLH